MSEYYNHTFSDEEWESIEEEADRLFRDSERRRGSIRGQVIQKEDHLHFWAAVAVQNRRAAPVVTNEMVRAAAIAISGAPFPSKRSMDKARAALTAALEPDNAN